MFPIPQEEFANGFFRFYLRPKIVSCGIFQGSSILVKRIDQGSDAIARTIKNLFSDIIPVFGSALLALGIMFTVNKYVGLLATLIIPVYFWLSLEQAKKQKGVRVNIRDTREGKTQELFSTLTSIKISFYQYFFSTIQSSTSSKGGARESVNSCVSCVRAGNKLTRGKQ